MESVVYYDFEEFRLDVKNEQLLKNSKTIAVTGKAFKTLLILVQNFGQVVKKEDIINQIWHDSFVEEANLTQHIYVLRKTLGNNKDGKPFIETIPKRGYCFIGEVCAVKISEIAVTNLSNGFQTQGDDSVLNEPFIFFNEEDKQMNTDEKYHRSTDSQIGFSTAEYPVKAKNKSTFSTSFWIIFGIITLLALGVFLFQKFQTIQESNIKSIAVLPFKPIGEESNDAKLGFGIADAVITGLSKVNKIPVRPTSAVFQYTDKTFDPILVGKELGVDSVLEGTVQRDGEWVRVSVRLIEINNGATLWAESFDEKFTNIFAVQDSISMRVAKTLTLNLSDDQARQLIARNTSNTEAFQEYQVGVYFWNKRTKDDLEKAVGYFQKAIQIDENFALSFAMLADSYNMLYYYRFTENSAETLDKAEIAAGKALKLNDNIAEAHIAMSYIQIAKYKDYNSATRFIERAVQLSPFNSTARIRYGWQLLRQDNLDETLEQMRIAQENDPLSPISNSALCSILMFKRQFPQALKHCEKAVEIQPSTPGVKVQLGDVYFFNGRTEEAIEILKDETRNELSKYDALASLAFIYVKTNRSKEAREIYLQLKNDPTSSQIYSDLTLIAFTLGEKKEALDFCKELAKKNRKLPPLIKHNPYWEELLKDEDFLNLFN